METQTRFVHELGHDKKIHIRNASILAMCGIYIIQFLTQSYHFKLFLGLLSVVVFFICLTSAKSVPRYMGFVMFVAGMAIYTVKGDGVQEILNEIASGIVTNLPLLTLVILVPLISIPLKKGGYFASIHFYLERLAANVRKLYGSLTLFMFCLGPILNLGSIRVLHEMVKDLRLSSEILAKAYLVGFSTVILWSPYFSSVALVLYYLEIPVIDYLPFGFSLAVIQFAVGNLVFWLWDRKKDREILAGGREPNRNESGGVLCYGEAKASQEEPRREWEDGEALRHRQKIRSLLFILLALTGLIFLFEFFTGWPMMFLVSLMSIGYPLVWAAWSGKWRDLGNAFCEFESKSVSAMNNEIVLFLSAGLFAKALEGTAVAGLIRMFLNEIASVSFLLFVVLVQVLIICLTFIGIHQVVVVTALVTQMDAATIGTSPEVLALMLMTAWSISAVLSPVNPLNLLVSGLVKRPALLVGLKWNGLYLCALFVIGSLFVYFLH